MYTHTIYICIHTYIHIDICIYMYIYTHRYIIIDVYICIYIYIYVYVFRSVSKPFNGIAEAARWLKTAKTESGKRDGTSVVRKFREQGF